MASIKIRVNTPVSIALNKNPSELTEYDKELLKAYNEAMSAKESELQARIEERDRNYQDAIISGLEGFLKQTDENINFILKQDDKKKYLKAINDYIDILNHNRGKGFLWEYREKINSKIRELKLLYANIDV